MAANLRNLQLQSKSIKNIQKLTNSMKMVAATRFKQAERHLVAARPLGVGVRKFYDLVDQDLKPSSKLYYLVPFTSDRGLCGSCHYKTCKAVTTQIDDKKHDYKIICVGEKAKNIISFKKSKMIALVFNGIGHRNPTFKTASIIAFKMLTSDGFKEGTLFYCQFISSLSFLVKQVRVYSAEALSKASLIVKYEVDYVNDVDSYVEFTLAALVFHALTESYGVELFSRMNAMASASKNASNLHQKMITAFNTVRQTLITRDLIDIVSGASVVNIKKKSKRRPAVPIPQSPTETPPTVPEMPPAAPEPSPLAPLVSETLPDTKGTGSCS